MDSESFDPLRVRWTLLTSAKRLCFLSAFVCRGCVCMCMCLSLNMITQKLSKVLIQKFVLLMDIAEEQFLKFGQIWMKFKLANVCLASMDRVNYIIPY